MHPQFFTETGPRADRLCTYRCKGCGNEIIGPPLPFQPPGSALVLMACARCTPAKAKWSDLEFYDSAGTKLDRDSGYTSIFVGINLVAREPRSVPVAASP